MLSGACPPLFRSCSVAAAGTVRLRSRSAKRFGVRGLRCTATSTLFWVHLTTCLFQPYAAPLAPVAGMLSLGTHTCWMLIGACNPMTWPGSVFHDFRTEVNGAQLIDLSSHKLGRAILTKADGTTVYLSRDVAAANDRMAKLDFDKLIYVAGATQDLHFRQLFKTLALCGHSWVSRLGKGRERERSVAATNTSAWFSNRSPLPHQSPATATKSGLAV